MRADNRGEGGILALTALVSRGPRAQRAAALVARRLRHLRRRDVLRRRHDHAGDLGALAPSRGSRSSRPRCIRSSCRSTRRDHGRAVRRSRSTAPRASAAVRPGHVRVVRRASRCSARCRSSSSPACSARSIPCYALRFFADASARAFLALGAVVLAVTGTEALYADMGHFGRVADPPRVAVLRDARRSCSTTSGRARCCSPIPTRSRIRSTCSRRRGR